MNVKLTYFLICLFICSFSKYFCKQKKNFIVVIDPGHGGDDFGAYGYGQYEKNLTLSIAKRLGYYIEKNHLLNVEIVYTRTKDIFVPLISRINITNNNHANLFISIHCNTTPRISSYGTESYIIGLCHKQNSFNIVKRENAVIFLEQDYKNYYKNSNLYALESIIKLTLIQNIFLKKSIELAKKIEKQFISIGRHSRGIKQSGFLVIKEIYAPAVLIETGFITNKDENKYLKSFHGQNNIAKAIYKAFLQFKIEYDNKNNNNKTLIINEINHLIYLNKKKKILLNLTIIKKYKKKLLNIFNKNIFSYKI